MISFKMGGIYKKKNSQEKIVNYIVFEDCLKGTLMDYIIFKTFDEEMAKYFCKTILQG